MNRNTPRNKPVHAIFPGGKMMDIVIHDEEEVVGGRLLVRVSSINDNQEECWISAEQLMSIVPISGINGN